MNSPFSLDDPPLTLGAFDAIGHVTATDDQYLLVPSDPASIAVVRSLQVPSPMWQATVNGSGEWISPSGIKVRRTSHGVGDQVHPRTADVALIVAATHFESWPENQDAPSKVFLTATQISSQLYRPPKHGAAKTEHRRDVTRILEHLATLDVRLPQGTAVFPRDPKTGRRKRTMLASMTRVDAIRITQHHKDGSDGGDSIVAGWFIRPPQWLRHFPRQFTPVARALIQLPARHDADRWIKSIGVDLGFYYRQDSRQGPEKTLRVATLIERAGLQSDIDAMVGSRHARRAYERLEYALDECRDLGAVARWRYHPQDEAALFSSSSGWLDRWYRSRVLITAPDRYASIGSNTKRSRR